MIGGGVAGSARDEIGGGAPPPICVFTNVSLLRCCEFCGSRSMSFSSTFDAASKFLFAMCASARLFIEARMFVSSFSFV
jgi:hypothetical protein